MSKHDDLITVRHEGAVAVVSLNRPAAGNAFDLATARAFFHAAIAVDCDSTVRAVLLRSEGKLFSAGRDINGFAGAGDRTPELLSEETGYLHAGIARLARMDKPLVIAVQGFAAGAGFSLAMLGDIVIAGEAAQFTLAYTGIGLTPDGGASWLLPRLVGLRKAQEMILLNTRLSATEALDAGLVTRVVPDADLATEAMKAAQFLATGPTRAFARSRELLLCSFEDSFETHLERESRGIVKSAASAEGKEGIAAFIAKRKPAFGSKYQE
jgi:2-(1,2-epoxy-1,2-dihydrophenyl)acetyl-CoA isomerase